MREIEDIIVQAEMMGASDIHLVHGLSIRVRVDGKMVTMDNAILTDEELIKAADVIAGDKCEKIKECGEIDLAKTFGEGIRTRINLFRSRGHISAAIRILNDHIPEIEELHLPPVVSGFPDYRTGIILVTGETGSGKSTTLAAVLNRINKTRDGHIITLEDPVEYVYTPDRCVINQREIGTDTASYQDGLRAVLREDPDVILIGEMRDLDTIETAITAAETGHLVFATLHTNSAADSIDRIINVFPEGKQKQIRLQLSTTLRVVLSQQLLPRKSGKGRVAACEVMVVNNAIQNLIREGKTPQIDSFITMNSREGSISMDNALLKLVNEGTVSKEEAALRAGNRDLFSRRH
ncbi:MAG: type IV pilus twitching motility protein PilT [Lachnospiraceae bacterium]|jgi:twitching motility protein PilT